jgi:signal transduction histidine kinase
LNFARAEVSPKITVFAEYRECQPEANLPSRSERIYEPDLGQKISNTHGEWLLAIQDNGMGMAAKDLENIFASFPYLDKSPEDRSMGMSLLICRKIVESYGGSFWVESTPGLGNCFYFTMPMQ